MLCIVSVSRFGEEPKGQSGKMPGTTYLNYFDSINEAKVKAVMASLAELINKQRPDALYILLSSDGGMVSAGITLYNYLRSLPLELIMHNTGNIDSIGNVVFLAGNTRYASLHSSFMFHGITQNFNEKVSLTKRQLLEVLSSIEASEAKIAGIITERSKMSAEEVRGLFEKGETKSPAFAKEKGIVSDVKDPSIPKGATILSANFQ